MADKFISAYSKSTAPSGADKVITEASTDGVYLYQDRVQLHTLYTGEFLDSASGVDLLVKAGANQAITIAASNGAITANKLLVTEGQLQCAAVVRVAAGVRESGNLEFLTKGHHHSFLAVANNTTAFAMVMPSAIKGATTVTLKALGYAQVDNTPASTTLTATLMTPAGITYTGTGVVTPANLGADLTATFQSAMDTAEAAFLAGEGVALTTGDVFMVKISASIGNERFACSFEIVHT